MKTILKTSLIIFALFTSSISFGEEITEDMVKGLFAKMDTAVESLSLPGVSKLISRTAKFTLRISTSERTKTIKANKKEYLEMLRQGWETAQNYEYSYSNLKIDLQGNKAVASVDIVESMTMLGQRLSQRAKEVITIQLINGKPLIVNIVATTSI